MGRKWSARLTELERSCEELISRGGADYDGQDVNPTTVLEVLAGNGSSRVLPRVGVASLFLWVTTHGSAHPISVGIQTTPDGHERPVPIADEAVCEQSASLDENEWFWIMPHRARDPSGYQFIRFAGYTIDPDADPAADHPHLPLYVVYWQQVFQVLHAMHERDAGRRIVVFYQFCLAGGHLSFLQRNAIRQHWGVDKWPIFMVASAAANQNSLGATLTNIFIDQLRGLLVLGGTERLGHLFKAVEAEYWRQHHKVALMNQKLPEFRRLGQVQQYHTPCSGIENATVRSVFSNKLPPAEVHEQRLRDSEMGVPEGADLGAPCEVTSAARTDGVALEELVETIGEMGFDREAVQRALTAAHGKPDLAIDILLCT